MLCRLSSCQLLVFLKCQFLLPWFHSYTRAVVFNWEYFAPNFLRDMWQYLETYLVVTAGGHYCQLVNRGQQTSHIAQDPLSLHPTKIHLAQNVHRAEAEKPCARGCKLVIPQVFYFACVVFSSDFKLVANMQISGFC